MFDREVDIGVLVIEVREEFGNVVRVFKDKESVIDVASLEERFKGQGALL